jgi:predicted DCC family thiol-disulfide oxidoreductase YuxK
VNAAFQHIPRINHPPTKPVMIFDGNCSFCRRWVARWRGWTQDLVDYRPYQEAAAEFPEIPPENFGKAAYLIEPNGRVSIGPHAAFRALQLAGRHRWLAWADEHLPGFALLAESAYELIAAHRDAADRIDLLLLGLQTDPPTFVFSRWLFLRALGLVYLVAFL